MYTIYGELMGLLCTRADSMLSNPIMATIIQGFGGIGTFYGSIYYMRQDKSYEQSLKTLRRTIGEYISIMWYRACQYGKAYKASSILEGLKRRRYFDELIKKKSQQGGSSGQG